jgi:hypothetical protein
MSSYKDWCVKTVLRRKIKFGLFATFTCSNYTVIWENNYEKWAILNKCIGYMHVFLSPLGSICNLNTSDCKILSLGSFANGHFVCITHFTAILHKTGLKT